MSVDNRDLAAVVMAAIRAMLPEIVAAVRTDRAEMPDRIIRPNDTHLYIGVRHTARDELIAQGKLKPPIPLTERAVGFLASDLLAYQQQCIAQRDAKMTAAVNKPDKKPPPPESTRGGSASNSDRK